MDNLEKMMHSSRTSDSVGFRDAFKQEAAERLSAQLATMKIDMAKVMFAKQEEKKNEDV